MRTNTQLESCGAEFLVLGNLLRRRIQAFITSQNFEDYDIVATNPDKNTSIKIQVKSRFKESDKSFIIKKFGSEFVVFVRLNCARKRIKKLVYECRLPPDFYVFPTKLCKKYNQGGKWHKVHLRDIPRSDRYKDNFDLIRNKLGLIK